MDNRDVWLHICSFMCNDTLELLSRTRLWLIVRELVNCDQFWHLRLCVLTGSEFKYIACDLWKSAYYCIESGHPEEKPIKMLLEMSHDCDYDWNPILDNAVQLGEPEVVHLLLLDSRVDSTKCNLTLLASLGTTQACVSEKNSLAAAILMRDNRVRTLNPIFQVMGVVLDLFIDSNGKVDTSALSSTNRAELMARANDEIKKLTE